MDVVRFLAEMIQNNRGKNGVSPEISTLVDTMNLNATGNVMTMALTIPEPTLEKMLESPRPRKNTATK